MSIEQQVDALNSLTQIMYDSAMGNYESMRCEFKYEAYEKGWSVASKYSFVRNGLLISKILNDPEDKASVLVHQLHDSMKLHTGGDWRGFVLSIDGAGRASTKFIY